MENQNPKGTVSFVLDTLWVPGESLNGWQLTNSIGISLPMVRTGLPIQVIFATAFVTSQEAGLCSQNS